MSAPLVNKRNLDRFIGQRVRLFGKYSAAANAGSEGYVNVMSTDGAEIKCRLGHEMSRPESNAGGALRVWVVTGRAEADGSISLDSPIADLDLKHVEIMGSFPSRAYDRESLASELEEGPDSRRVWIPRISSPERAILFHDGSCYFGEASGFRRNGFGVYICADGSEIEGTWVDDALSGEALYINADGSKAVRTYANGTVAFERTLKNEKKAKMKQAIPLLSSQSSSRSVTPSSSADLLGLKSMRLGPRMRMLASFNSGRVSTPPLFASTSSTSRMYRPKKAFDATSLLIPFDQIKIEKRISRSTCEACSVNYRGTWIGKEVVIRIFKRTPGPLEISISDIISRMARVRHANVALFMAASVNECDGTFAVVTELVANGSIETMMKKPSLQKVLHISSSVAIACAYLRRQGFVHGNLRPANILLDVSGTVKLSDYFVKEIEEIFHSPPCNRKSVNYLAPEALRTAPFVPFGVDSASDVYSFGLVCMQLISGKIPYKHLSVAQLRILVGYGAYRPDTRCVGSHFSALKKIAIKCTLQDPLMRPTFERLVVALNSLQTSSNSAPEDALITFISGK